MSDLGQHWAFNVSGIVCNNSSNNDLELKLWNLAFVELCTQNRQSMKK